MLAGSNSIRLARADPFFLMNLIPYLLGCNHLRLEVSHQGEKF